MADLIPGNGARSGKRRTPPRGELSMKTGERDTIAAHLKKAGVSRRSFLQLCSTLLVTAPVGLSLTGKATAAQIAKIVGKARRPSVIWLHGDVASNVGARRRAFDPRCNFPRLSRDSNGRFRRAGRSSTPLRHRGQCGKVCSGSRGRNSYPGRRRLHATRGQASDSGDQRSRGTGGGGDCHRLVRIVGRSAVGRSESNGRGGRRLRDFRKADRQSAGLPAESLQPAGGGSGIRNHGAPARARSVWPSEIRV